MSPPLPKTSKGRGKSCLQTPVFDLVLVQTQRHQRSSHRVSPESERCRFQQKINPNRVQLFTADKTHLRRLAFTGAGTPGSHQGLVAPANHSRNSCHAWVTLGSSFALVLLFPNRPSSSNGEKPNSALNLFMTNFNPFVPVPTLFFGLDGSPSPLFALPMYLQSATNPSKLPLARPNKPCFLNSASAANME